MDLKWAESLKVGDKVVIEFPYQLNLAKVKKITKTQIVTESYRFRKSDLNLVGGGVGFNKISLRNFLDERISDRLLNQDLSGLGAWLQKKSGRIPKDVKVFLIDTLRDARKLIKE